MNVIIAYLDTMFSTYPQTPRLLEAKAELQGMMEDAYTSLIAEGRSENEAVGQVIRDFGNLEEVAPVLGISSDIHPAEPLPVARESAPRHAVVTLEEAQGYSAAQERIRFRVATAIMLFILAPAAIIALPVAAQAGVVPLAQTAAVFIGLLVLFAFAATGVALILTTARETAPYRHLAEGRFTANPVVTRWAEALAEEHERGRIRGLQIAVALFIFAPLPLIAFALFLEDSPQRSFWTIIGVVLVLALVATGIRILLPRAWAHSAAERLRHGSGRPAGAPDDDAERGIIGVIAAFYWPLLTLIYLAWSFLGSAWSISWILWPIGALLFAALSAGSGAIESYRRAR